MKTSIMIMALLWLIAFSITNWFTEYSSEEEIKPYIERIDNSSFINFEILSYIKK